MKEYFVIFILFTIFILYSVTLVSKDLNRMRCVEGFEDTYTFGQLFSTNHDQGNVCESNQRMHYSSLTDGTYQLTCHDQCSTSNTSVPVSSNASNCQISSDSTTSNCEVSVSTKCYLDNAFHESSSNVFMYCPDSGYADCAQCEVTEGTCSIVDGTCQKIDSVTLPLGYARCTLSSSVYDVDHLTSDSNFVVSCDPLQCNSPISSGGSSSVSRISTTDGSCSTLECYGDADYSDGRFNIQEKVLGIKIESHTNFEFTLDSPTNIHSWANISIGITNDVSTLNNSLTQSNIDEIHENYMENGHSNVTIHSMNSFSSSTEYIIMNGGKHGVYFNYIKDGNTLYKTFETDGTTHNSSDHFVRENKFKMTIDENNHLIIENGHNGSLIHSNTLGDAWINNRTNFYFFIKVGPYHEDRFISNIRMY